MASITFLDPGTDATSDVSFYTITGGSGNITSDGTVAHTGPRSIKALSDGQANNPTIDTPAAILADAGSRWTCWIRFTTFPAVTTDILWNINGGGGAVYAVQISSVGVLGLRTLASTHTGSTLSTGIWYRLSLAHVVVDAPTYTIKLWLDGLLDASTTTGDGSIAIGSTGIRIGFFTANGTGQYNVDDLYVDNGATLDDPGDIRVTAKLPAANNTNNFDTAIGANPANRWTNVNERPLSQTNGWQHAAATDVQENYGLQTAATGDVDLTGKTIIGRMAWIWAKGAVGGAGTPKIMDNGTETAITLTATPALYFVCTTSASYPSNAAGIGMRSTNNADDTFLYECGTLIAYRVPGVSFPQPIARLISWARPGGGMQSHMFVWVSRAAAAVTSAGALYRPTFRPRRR